jgi:hypothetical protein
VNANDDWSLLMMMIVQRNISCISSEIKKRGLTKRKVELSLAKRVGMYSLVSQLGDAEMVLILHLQNLSLGFQSWLAL